MAATISDIGSATSNSATTSLTSGATITASVGDFLLAVVAADNAGTNGLSSISTFTDTSSNTWTRQTLVNNDPGAAAAGCTLAIWTAPITVALSSGTVTQNFTTNTTAKAMEVYRIQPGAGEVLS